MTRSDGRQPDELRAIKITRNYLPHAEGSVFFELGNTKIICTASIEAKVPMFLKGSGKGWITAEYSMIPRATDSRNVRESSQGRVRGRTHEIQRLIGRSLRSVVDLSKMGDYTIWIDCDVVHADGGTRTAAITGSYIALYDALHHMIEKGYIKEIPMNDFVAATSVGIIDGTNCLDLCYEEDSAATVDMNIVMTDSGKIIEIQGTGEEHPFSRQELDDLVELATTGIDTLVAKQRQEITSDLSTK